MSKLIDTYKAIIEALGLRALEDGSIFQGDERYLIKSKPLYLPLNSVLSDPSVVDKLIFHPLAEAAAKGESDVVEDLRLRMVNRLNRVTAKAVFFFLALGSGETKSSLDPEQMRVMAAVKDVSEKEQTAIKSIITATARGEGKKFSFIKIYLQRAGGTKNGKKYHRTAVVTFPLYQAVKAELESKEKGYSVLGVTITKKGLQSLMRILEYIFPNLGEEGQFNEGGVSILAPFCDALFRAVGNLTAHLNEKINLFKEIEPELLQPLSDGWTDVVDIMDSLFSEVSLIPVQPNADGKARVSDVQTASLSVHTQPAAQQAPQQPGQAPQVQIQAAPQMQPVYQQPVQQAAPQVHAEPEWIQTPNGVKRNPNYFPQHAMASMAGYPQQPGMRDPFNSPVMLPAGSQQLTQAQMLVTPPGGVVRDIPPGMYVQPQPYGAVQGYPQPMMQPQMYQPGYPQQPMMYNNMGQMVQQPAVQVYQQPVYTGPTRSV